MRVESWDSVFVRARRLDIHPLAREVTGYARWWPRLEARAAGGWVLLVHRPALLLPHLRVRVRVSRERTPHKGVHLECAGDLAGRAEWFYLDEPDGTVVHHLLDARASAGGRRRLAAYRASVRAGLHALKDLLEAGRPPGAEPDPALRAHQRRAARQLLPGAGERARRRGPDAGRGSA